MSIEKALLDNAAAQTALAAAMNRYANVMESMLSSGVKIIGTEAQIANATTSTATQTAGTEPTTEKPKRGRPAGKPAAAAKPAETPEELVDDEVEAEDDPFGDDDEAEEEATYTAADVRAAILKVRDKGGEKKNAEGAKAVLKALGVGAIAEIPEDKYAKAIELCNKALGKK